MTSFTNDNQHSTGNDAKIKSTKQNSTAQKVGILQDLDGLFMMFKAMAKISLMHKDFSNT